MSNIRISHPNRNVEGCITLDGSKSLSNRALIIRALCEDDFEIHNLSSSDDTVILKNILENPSGTLDVHHAGTSFRFLTAFLAFHKETQLLTGSARMQDRPIGILVDALRSIGAEINYTKKEGFPPLEIGVGNYNGVPAITLPANVSSQFVSALLLIGPTLDQGINITLSEKIVSKSYIEMTLKMMEYFGIEYQWDENTISIAQQKYIAKDYFVESDWSAASYYYAIAAMSKKANITLQGLQKNSTQGDSAIVDLGLKLGVKTVFGEHEVTLTRTYELVSEYFEHDFINCPDIAQTIVVMLASRGVTGLLKGLQTLYIKETNRIQALDKELAKFGAGLSKLPAKFSKKSNENQYLVNGRIDMNFQNVSIDTYQDHRMAMSFAPLSVFSPLTINDADVVSKSYSSFWDDLSKLGFVIEVLSEN